MPPAVLILHLKRFQVGPRGMFRKITKHVTFPLVLDIAPFCASKVKKLDGIRQGQKQLPYSLYGIVEHSGTMHGGHYVAYVKVRQRFDIDDPRWHFIPTGLRHEFLTEKEKTQPDITSDTDSEISSDSDSCSVTSSASSDGEDGDAAGAGAIGGIQSSPRTSLPPLPPPLPGKWYYISDSRVSAVSEAEVLNTQAYLLFYERIDVVVPPTQEDQA